MDLQKPRSFIEKLNSKSKLSTCGFMVPSKSIGELIEIFVRNGGTNDGALSKIDPAVHLDDRCVDIVTACKNGGISQSELETNRSLCRVLRHIIEEQKKKLVDNDKNDDEAIFKFSMGYKRAVEVICSSFRKILPIKRTVVKEKNIDEIKKELKFLKEVGALSK